MKNILGGSYTVAESDYSRFVQSMGRWVTCGHRWFLFDETPRLQLWSRIAHFRLGCVRAVHHDLGGGNLLLLHPSVRRFLVFEIVEESREQSKQKSSLLFIFLIPFGI